VLNDQWEIWPESGELLLRILNSFLLKVFEGIFGLKKKESIFEIIQFLTGFVI